MNRKNISHGFSGIINLVSDMSDIDFLSIPEVSSQTPIYTNLTPSIVQVDENQQESFVTRKTEKPQRTGSESWKWVLGTIFLIIFLRFITFVIQEIHESSGKSPVQSSKVNQPNQATLFQKIENEKARATKIENQLREMDNNLENYDRRMRSYFTSGMTEEYNILVPSYNSLVNERNNLYEEYKRLIAEINMNVSLYNLGRP